MVDLVCLGVFAEHTLSELIRRPTHIGVLQLVCFALVGHQTGGKPIKSIV